MKIGNEIGHREALTLLIIMMSAKIFLSFPRNMVFLGATAGWLIVLLAGFFSLIGFYFIYSINRKFPADCIIVSARKITGNLPGIFLGIMIFLFFLVMTSLSLRQFAESFILSILPRTPISIITLFFLSLLIYATLLGIETLSRVAWLFGPYLLIALATILAFALPQVNGAFIFPLFGKGLKPILSNSITQLSLFSEVLLFGLIAPLIHKKEKRFKVGLYSLLISILINTTITIILLLVFNYNSANRVIFPIFQLSRLIIFGAFIQRVEAVFVFLWFFTAGIQLSGLFYGTVISFTQTFKINDYRPLVFPLALLTFTLSLIPSSMTEAVNLNDFILSPFYLFIAFGVPFLLWLVSIIFKKSSGETNEQK